MALSIIAIFPFTGLIPLGDTLAMMVVNRHGLDYGRVRLWGSLAFIAAATLLGKALADWPVSVLPWLMSAALLLTAACDDGGDFGKAVPFARESLDGRAFVLPRDGDGKVVMLHFWSGAAPGGGALLPALEELWFEQRDRGLLLLAVRAVLVDERGDGVVERR